MELNMDEVWEWPTFEAFKFRGLVFFDPCIGSELQAQDQLRGILYSLPPSELKLLIILGRLQVLNIGIGFSIFSSEYGLIGAICVDSTATCVR